ncbi:MAG: hypothetical protein E7Z80_05125 [Methanobrevibacter thaueri]|nr:hypothetical protein [Methanobrevibacter thaueri]
MNTNMKKIILLSILFIFIISISSISAADENNNLTVNSADSNIITSDIDVEKLDLSNDNNVVNDNEATFTDLNNLIVNSSGNVIELTKDYKYNFDDSKDGIIISKNNIVINGNGHIIDGDKQSKIFTITGNNVILNNIIFKNAAIDNTYTIHNDDINYVLEGAAITWNGANGKLLNSQINDNTAYVKTVLAPDYYEGVISINCAAGVFWRGANGLINNTSFSNNIMNSEGDFITTAGAVQWVGANGIIEKSTFTSNAAPENGAILFKGEDGTISRSDFINNFAELVSAAIHTTGNNMQILDSNFKGNNIFNTLESITVVNEIGGAAIHLSSENSIISNCSFISNSAGISRSSTGGAVRIYGTHNILTDSTFINNTGSQGGGLCIYGNYNQIFNSIFINNTSPKPVYNDGNGNGFAGGMYIYGANISAVNCTFINNSADYAGGALQIGSEAGTPLGHGYAINCTFINNTANKGGAINLATIHYNTGKDTITGCIFINNTARTASGGAISISGDDYHGYVNGTISNSIFINNTGGTSGGAIMISRQNMHLKNLIMINNTAGTHGGGIASSVYRTFIYDSLFINNTAKSNGGSVYINGGSSVQGSTFINNTASENGGGCYATNTGTTINTSTFINNIAKSGGAVYINTGSITVIYNSIINSTNISNNGIRLPSSSTVKSNWFGTNTPSYHPGTSYLTAHLEKVKNQEYLIGGEWNSIVRVVFYDSASHEIIRNLMGRPIVYVINNSNIIFRGNYTNETGRIFTDANANQPFNITTKVDNQQLETLAFNGLTISPTNSFKDLQLLIDALMDGETLIISKDYAYNLITDAGISIINVNKTIKIEGTGIISAGNSIQIFNITADNVEIKDLTLTKGKSTTNGGAIIWSGNNGKLTNVKLMNNDAANYGGAVYATGNNTNIKGSTFTGNTAVDGSSLYLIGDEVSLADSTFNNNKATNGVDVYIKGAKTKLANVTENNTNGNSIKISGVNSTIIDLTLNVTHGKGLIVEGNNTQIEGVDIAGGEGTSIAITGDNTTITDITANGHNGDVIDLTGNNTQISDVVAINNVNGTIIKTNGTSTIEDIAAYGGNSTVIDATGNNTVINGVIVEEHTGDVVKAEGNDVNINGVNAYDNDGDIISVIGNNANVDELNINGGEGTVVNVTGNNAIIDGINTTGHIGETAVVDGTGAKISNIPAGDPEKVFVFPTILTNTPTFEVIGLPDDSTGYFTVKINGELNKVEDIINGSAKITLDPIAAGKYSILLTYTGDEKYQELVQGEIITIPHVPAGDKDKVFIFPANITGNSTVFEVNGLIINATGNFTVTIDDKLINSTPIINGSASITVNNLTEGDHNVTLGYTGDDYYESMSKEGKITVPKIVHVITLSANNLTVEYSAQQAYTVKILIDGKNITDGENVTINYNGVNQIVKTANGYASFIPTTTLKIDKYTITATYKDKKITNTVNILNIINAAKLKKLKKSKKVNKVKVSLAKVNGKILVKAKLTLKVKGKKVATAKTNSKGTATFKVKKKSLKKLKPGKAVATVTYGNDILTKTIKISK